MPSKLSEAECRSAIESGEFPLATRTLAPAVALILTQSWCPQWSFMRGYLEAAETSSPAGSITIAYVEYDREPFFEEFMGFKEDVLRNRSVPYVRYYRDGKLVAESNYISLQGFLSKLGIQK